MVNVLTFDVLFNVIFCNYPENISFVLFTSFFNSNAPRLCEPVLERALKSFSQSHCWRDSTSLSDTCTLVRTYLCI